MSFDLPLNWIIKFRKWIQRSNLILHQYSSITGLNVFFSLLPSSKSIFWDNSLSELCYHFPCSPCIYLFTVFLVLLVSIYLSSNDLTSCLLSYDECCSIHKEHSPPQTYKTFSFEGASPPILGGPELSHSGVFPPLFLNSKHSQYVAPPYPSTMEKKFQMRPPAPPSICKIPFLITNIS